MTAKFERFKAALIVLCEDHGVALHHGDYDDDLCVWDREDSDKFVSLQVEYNLQDKTTEQKSDKKQFITIVKTEQAGTVIHDFYTAAFHARHLIVVEGIIVYPQSFANQINGLTEFEFISAKKEATAQQAA